VYRTNFGPCAAHTGVILCKCDACTGTGLRRVTALPWPDEEGKAYTYRSNQTIFLYGHVNVHSDIAKLYHPYFDGYTNAEEEAALHHADPHEKKALRIEAWAALNSAGYRLETRHQRLWLEKVKYKLKTNEIAKLAKYARMIGDLGCAASLQGFVLTARLKEAQSTERIYIYGGTIETVKKPSQSKLREVFKQLIAPKGRFYYVIFSDDACYSVRHNGKVYTFNIDISKCDASHGATLFSAFTRLFPARCTEDAAVLVDQCRLPIQIDSSETRKRKAVLTPIEPTLYSGSTITTVLNNFASLNIALSVAETGVYDATGIMAAAKAAGYHVTTETCARYVDIQFLKHSPVRDINGAIQPVLNLGVLLRSSGTCRGDLPGRGPLRDRAKAFQQALLQGAYPLVHFPLIDAMKSSATSSNFLTGTKLREAARKEAAKVFRYKVDTEGETEHLYFTASAVYERYSLTVDQQAELDYVFGGAGYRHHYASSGTAAIYEKDYGITAKYVYLENLDRREY